MNQPNIYAHGGNLDLRTDRQRVLWLILFIFLSIILLTVIWSWYKMAFPKEQMIVSCGKFIPGLTVSITYPTYMAIGDQGELVVTVKNSQSPTKNVPLDDSNSIVVYFPDKLGVNFDPKSSNIIKLKDLAPGEIRTQIIKFSLSRKPKILSPQGREVVFGIRVAGHYQSCEGKTAVITTAPLYMLQTIVIPFAAKFGVGAVFVAIIGLIWDKVKAFLNPA